MTIALEVIIAPNENGTKLIQNLNFKTPLVDIPDDADHVARETTRPTSRLSEIKSISRARAHTVVSVGSGYQRLTGGQFGFTQHHEVFEHHIHAVLVREPFGR